MRPEKLPPRDGGAEPTPQTQPVELKPVPETGATVGESPGGRLPAQETALRRPRRFGNTRLLGVLALVVAAVLAYGVYWLVFVRGTVSTEDAYVDARMVSVSSRLPGQVVRVAVAEGERVSRGQVLVELARGQMLIRRDEFLAEIREKEAKYAGMLGPARQELRAVKAAEIDVNEIELAQKARTLERLRTLAAVQAVSRQEMEDLTAEVQRARAQLEVSRREMALLEAGESGSAIGRVAAELELARVRLRDVEADLAALTVRSPLDGVAARRTVEPGEVVQAGQGLFQVVETGQTWVVANLEEGELDGVKPGQQAEITVDAFPGRRFRGRVGAAYGATLSRFSLLSTSSASGNFIKVTQRVPVRIDWAEDTLPEVFPGMNAVVTIRLED